MRIKVKYFAYVRDLVKDKTQEDIMVGKPITLRELLEILVKKYGKELEKYLLEKTGNNIKIAEKIIILVNGESTDDLNYKLKDNDTVSIMPFLGGG